MFGVGLGAVCVALLAAAPPARPCGYGMPSPLMRFLQAECVVAGRVVGFEDQNVHTLPFANAPQDREYKVAVVHVLESLKGAPGEPQVRIGLFATQNLRNGQEAIFFLVPHFEEPFYLLQTQYDYPINRDNNPEFETRVAQYRRWGRALTDPLGALQVKDARARAEAATLLLIHHRTFRPAEHRADRKLEPLDAAQSKLILEGLAGADWNGATDFRSSPGRAFAMLGATAKDGWNPQGLKTSQEFEQAARGWLRDNAGTFRVTTFARK
jgi:hypothetical protein